MVVHHIGFLTDDINAAREEFSLLGYRPTGSVIRDEVRGVDIQFIESENQVKIELIQSFKDDSVVSGLLSKFKNKVYHTCYKVEDIVSSIKKLEGEGFMVIDDEKYAPALDGNVVFLYGHKVGMIELFEKK